MEHVAIHLVPFGAAIPDKESVSSASVFAFDEKGDLLTTEHVTRGTDIPGGHVDPGDGTVIDALNREAMEEAGALIHEPALIATLTVEPNPPKYQGKRMYIFVARFTLCDAWNPAPDVTARAVISPEQFLEKYRGNMGFMTELLRMARERVGMR